MKILQAVKDKIFVEVLRQDEITESGLLIRQEAIDPPQKLGLVVSVGKETGEEVLRGDIICFAKHGGQVSLFNGKEYRSLALGEIYGVLKEI